MVIRNITALAVYVAFLAFGIYVSCWVLGVEPIMNACQAYDEGTLTGTIIGVTIIKCIASPTVGAVIIAIGKALAKIISI